MDEYLLSIGDKIGDCVIIRSLGKGGFSQVYLADCKRLGLVALKLYSPELDYTDFFNEVMIMGLFSNKPYFVKFLGASEFSSPYLHILLEYMEGGDLRQRIQCGMEVNDAIQVLYSIACALGDMHAIGMIHRDVCPENIFFDASGLPKLGDMGFASKAEEFRSIPFKQTYTAPEIFQGANHSPASDVYSLGVCLYEMLGGRPKEVLPHESIDFFNIPDHLKEIIQKACNIVPEKRCSAEELARDCVRLLSMNISTVYWNTEKPRHADLSVSPGKTLLKTDRENAFLEKWDKEKEELFIGLKDDLQQTLTRALFFSLTVTQQKVSNCYLGLEHVLWTLLERESTLSFTLLMMKVAPELIRKEIFNGLKRIEYFPSARAVSMRLEDLLRRVKERFPQGVGIKEFTFYLLEQETFFSWLLRKRGVEPKEIIMEMKKNEI